MALLERRPEDIMRTRSTERCAAVPGRAGILVAAVLAIVPGSTSYRIALPLLQQSVTLTATVAVAGDTLAIAAFNAAALQHFGEDVALSNDTLAVGAAPEADGGAVHVFRRTGTTWQQEAHLKASNAEAEDHFGNAVALSGDTLVIGAASEDSEARGVGGAQTSNTARDSGAIYIFH
jgi:hypothetical protein